MRDNCENIPHTATMKSGNSDAPSTIQ
jgi:hypothetical protein